MVDGLVAGTEPAEILKRLIASDSESETRQLALVSASSGRSASFTGNAVLSEAVVIEEDHLVVCGNLLASRDVTDAVMAEFKLSSQESRLEAAVKSLMSGVEAGGDVRGTISGCVLFSGEIEHLGYRFHVDRVEVRIDWSSNVAAAIWNAMQQRLSYLLVKQLALQTTSQHDLEEIELLARRMAENDPDASAAVLLCATVIDPTSAGGRGQSLAEELVSKYPGPGANAPTLGALWGHREGMQSRYP
jgi:uncharacterized Ntn-hydrolase superfamily protein